MKSVFKTSVLVLALSITHTAPARADIWGDIGGVINKAVDASADVLTLGEQGRRRDEQWAREQEEKAQLARQAAENARQQEIYSLLTLIQQNVSHRNDLQNVVDKASAVLSAQDEIAATVSQIILGQGYLDVVTTDATQQAQFGSEVIGEVMAALKIMYSNSSEKVTDEKTISSYEVGLMALAEIAQENGVTVKKLITETLLKQKELGRNLETLSSAVAQRRLEIKVFYDAMTVRLNDVKAQLNTSIERLKALDPSRVPQV